MAITSAGLGQKQGSAEYYGRRNAKQYPENR